ncbi:ly6/PLAUR domain-containing protein 6-like [Gadus morhua]|uniref:ly6/PLAUR domain-containing protein 6-like n=1 Tax=Gadus morhua TaxID=8049 RepID=UPI0011B46070|nr:ly6/PLAUR domain-containing protein 6-like [Gadus morhua]
MGYVCILFVLSLTISTAGGIKCYSCVLTEDPLSCLKTEECPSMDRCYSLDLTGHGGGLTKGCLPSVACALGPVGACCEGDLCNLGNATGSSFILLLLSTAALYFL